MNFELPEKWKESEDFDETLMQEMRQSWAVAPVRSYDGDVKTLYILSEQTMRGR